MASSYQNHKPPGTYKFKLVQAVRDYQFEHGYNDTEFQRIFGYTRVAWWFLWSGRAKFGRKFYRLSCELLGEEYATSLLEPEMYDLCVGEETKGATQELSRHLKKLRHERQRLERLREKKRQEKLSNSRSSLSESGSKLTSKKRQSNAVKSTGR